MTMTLLKAPALAAASLLVLSGCAANQDRSEKPPMTEKQMAILEKELGGKVAGEPVRCISQSDARNMIRVSDDVVLFRASGKLIWRNDLRGSCNGLANDRDIVVSEQFGTSQSCENDTWRMVDRTSGIQGGFCTLGQFTPYRKVDEAK